MKKTFLGALLFAGTLAFTACQNETLVYVDENGNPIENAELQEGEGILKITVSSTDATSRAVRPVGSSAAANNVSEVKVYAFKEIDGVYKFDNTLSLSNELSGVSCEDGIFTVTGLKPVGDHANTSMNSHTDQTKILTLKGLARDAKYKFVAVGYNDTYPYGTLPTSTAISGNIALADFIQITEPKYSEGSGVVGGLGIDDVEELFAGVSDEYETQADKAAFNDEASVTITRQVAGMLGYFKNIPTKIGEAVVKYVRVYANKEFTKFKFPAQLLTAPDFNGVDANITADKEGKFLVMEFDISAIATNWNGGTPTGSTYTFENWTNGKPGGSTKAPLATGYTAPDGLKLVENSIFGGRYLIPYDQHVDSQTLTVELQDKDGKALKTLNVVTDEQTTPSDGTKNAYDIRCNNFYSIGKKLDTDSTDGGDPDPEDPDEPVDLSGDTDIKVIVNDAWKVLHNMGVEE